MGSPKKGGFCAWQTFVGNTNFLGLLGDLGSLALLWMLVIPKEQDGLRFRS